MKKLMIAGIIFSFFSASAVAFGETVKTQFMTSQNLKIIHSVPHQVPDRGAKEPEIEPNDWDGSQSPFPPDGWAGDLGILSFAGPRDIVGFLESTGFDPPQGGWYTGDTDLYGFNIDEPGILEVIAYFQQPCDPDDAIYNIWFLAEGSLGNLYILDGNFNYIDGVINEFLECPYYQRTWTTPGFMLDSETGETADYLYTYVAGATGGHSTYTLSIFYFECNDDDGDGHPDDECERGWDCDDTNPDIHTNADEICDDGVDNDCDEAIDDDDEDCASGICFVRSLF